MPRSPWPDQDVNCCCCEQYQAIPGQRKGRCEAMEEVLRQEGHPECTVMVREDRGCFECDSFEPTPEYLDEYEAMLAEQESIRRDGRG